MSPTPRAATPALSIAPMMDVTDRHFRWFARRLSRHVLLYTEMVVAQALIHGDREHLLRFDASEHPIALQLGGDDPVKLALCARMAEDAGYDEVNLNVGCPSPRVQSGSFGVVLMRRPHVVAEAVAAMRAEVRIPVTVKHRIGLDELDRFEDMLAFVDAVAPAGAARFTVHARKAWTQGLSPKQNRNVPPLRHAEVHRLKRLRPELHVEINGGIRTLDEVEAHLAHVDAVMIGRAARDTPWILAGADARIFGCSDPGATRASVARAMVPYLARTLGEPRVRLHHVTRHLAPLFAGEVGARAWRRTLAQRADLGAGVIEAALEAVEEARRLQEQLAQREAAGGSGPPRDDALDPVR
ncbi:MAG TPA: tRNA dihydrouridine(20/20a) synthase DusA [Deltaproteobacteria bacterium]|nr:tRNA dihydrouridine(20/20a) synthase DusA [Deltaproteobacteria bacterium]